MYMEMSIKEKGGESDATREAGTIKLMKISTGRTGNATSVVKKDIRCLISQRLKKIKTGKGVPEVELA